MKLMTVEEFSVHEKETQKWTIADAIVEMLTNRFGDAKAIESATGIDKKNIYNWRNHKSGVSDQSFETFEAFCRGNNIDISALVELFNIYKGWSSYSQSAIDKYRQPFIPEGKCKIWPDGEIPWENVWDIKSTVYDIAGRIPYNALRSMFYDKIDYILPRPEYFDIMQMKHAFPDKNLAEIYASEAKIPFSSAMQVIIAYNKFCVESKILDFGEEYWMDMFSKWNASNEVNPSWHYHMHLVTQFVQKIFDTEGRFIRPEDNDYETCRRISFNLEDFLEYNSIAFNDTDDTFVCIGDMTTEIAPGDYTKTVNIDINGCHIFRHSPVYPPYITDMLDVMNVSKSNTKDRVQKFADARGIKIKINEEFYEEEYAKRGSYKYDWVRDADIKAAQGSANANSDEELEEYFDDADEPVNEKKERFKGIKELIGRIKGEATRGIESEEEYPKFESYYVYARPKKTFREFVKWYNDIYINPADGVNPYVK